MTQKALKLALWALEIEQTHVQIFCLVPKPHLTKALVAVNEALAQPEQDYERGFVDGMQKQMQSSVDKAVNRMAQPEQEPWCMKMNGCKTKCEDCPDEPPQTEQEPVAVYGYCPECNAKGVMRERRPNGNDKCANGHTYPSSKSTPPQLEQEPIYQYQMANGSWIDQTKESHDYNVRHGQATVRVVHTAPPQLEQEPVADDFFRMIADRNPKPFPLPQRWVGLTNEEIEVLFQTAAGADEEVHIRFARAIESKIKELNT